MFVKIYTKTGDDGTTGIQNGTRISKSDSRIQAYGMVDEINSCLGVILSKIDEKDLKNLITKIQNDLFVVGSDLSNPNLKNTQNRVNDEMIMTLEENIDKLENNLSPITNFILPGGHEIAALIHVSRSITRRAETFVISLSEKEKISANCMIYLNRLSDLLFVIARTINQRKNVKDIIWNPKKDTLVLESDV